MALSISLITDIPQPPLKTDPANFASRADSFLASLPNFVTETNAAITEMNKITSGLDQQSPIAAYSVSTTYNFPDVVAGSDGYTYRCVETSVTGQNPVGDDGTYWVRVGTPLATESEALSGAETTKAVSPATALAMIRAMALPSPPSGVDVTGNIFGMDLSKTGANQVTVSAGACLDSTLSAPLVLSAATPVTIPSVANTVYHIFVVRLVSDGSKEVRCYTSEAAAASDTEVDAYRWVGWWKTDGAADAVGMTNRGEYYLSNKASDWVVSGSIGTSYATVDHSAFIPESRVELIEYGVRDVSIINSHLFASDDGINLCFLVGLAAASADDTNRNAWGYEAFQKTSLKPFNADRQFKSSAGPIDLLIHAIKVRR